MIRKLAITMHKAFGANPGIQFEIFLHKIDGMSEDYRLGSSPLSLFSPYRSPLMVDGRQTHYKISETA